MSEPENRLFVYGIFLSEFWRKDFNMQNPRYATVKDYITVGGRIVQAVPVDPEVGACLTGLIVEADPKRWKSLDALEGGYDRVVVKTTDNKVAYMYVGKG